MILNMDNPQDQRYFSTLQKGRGIQLISKYLPKLLVQKQVYAVNTIEEWNQIKDKLPEIVTIRVDNKNGNSIPLIGGVTCPKDKVENYFKEAMKKEREPYFLCMEFEEGTNERVDTQGAFLLDVTIGGNVHIGHTGLCFDCRELTKGKAEHETWTIPWDEILFMKSSNHRKYHIQTISQKGYRDSAIERMQFLIKEYPERKEEIINKMPKQYSPIKPYILENLIEQVLVPLYSQRSELLSDGLEKFDVELNILKDGRLVPMEICRPERFIVKKQETQKCRDDEIR